MNAFCGAGDFFNELAKLDEHKFPEELPREGLLLSELHNAGKISYNLVKLTGDFVAALTKSSCGRYEFCADFNARPYQVYNQSKGRVGRKQLHIRFDATPPDNLGCSALGVSIGLGFDFRNNQGINPECVDEYEKFHKKVCAEPALFDYTFGRLGGYAEPYEQFKGNVTAEEACQNTPSMLQPWLFFGRRLTPDGILAVVTLEDLVGECIKVFDMICEAGYYQSDKQRRYESAFNPSLTFENYLVGKMNLLAVSAATQVAELTEESCRWNPLFIYGKTGLGKTHLIQAIGNQICINRPHAKVCYRHAARYVSDVVRACQTDRFEEFEQYYHSLDVLLIDDFHLLAGKVKALEEFVNIFKILVDSRKHIILTSDVPLSEMEWLEPQLISRFGLGLTVAISQPDLETRADILLSKSASSQTSMNKDVAFFIAEHVNSDIRELEGALCRVRAYSKFHRRPITIDLAKKALRDCIAN